MIRAKAFPPLLPLLLLLAVVSPARAQDDTVVVIRRGVVTPVDRALSRTAVRMFNAAPVRIYGRAAVEQNDLFTSDVAVLDGPVVVNGEIEGTLVAINADVDLNAGSRVSGDVIVVGGVVHRDPEARVGGEVQANNRSVQVRRVGQDLVLPDDGSSPRRVTRSSSRNRRYRESPRSRASIALGTDGTYNRVEGLPYRGGIRIDWWGENSGRIDAFVIARTAGDFGSTSREDMGYRVGGRMGFGNRTIEVAGWAYDVVAPVESWQMADAEVGLAALFRHRDYRDYYLKRGYSASVTFRPTSRLALTGEYASDAEESVTARDPWTLSRGSEAWRPNPAIDDGTFTHFTGRVEWDSRRSRQGGSGWYLKAEWERGISDDVQYAPIPASVRGVIPVARLTYDRAWVDLRRYQAIGWSGGLNLRAVAGGTAGLDEDGPLPVQRRLSLGGPGPMPGYAFREFACNATSPDPALPALCDRMVLFQAEYRGSLTFGLLDFEDRASHGWPNDRDRFRGVLTGENGDLWFDDPQFVLLANAGSAWVNPDRPTKLDFDVGAGLEFGSIGIYAARALVADAPIRFTLRLYHRF